MQVEAEFLFTQLFPFSSKANDPEVTVTYFSHGNWRSHFNLLRRLSAQGGVQELSGKGPMNMDNKRLTRKEDAKGPETYFLFRQNVQDNCGLNLCLLDFVGCCVWTPSTGWPVSDVDVSCMADERTKSDRPREMRAMETLQVRGKEEEMLLIRLKKPLLAALRRNLGPGQIRQSAAWMLLVSNERANSRGVTHLYPTVRCPARLCKQGAFQSDMHKNK